MTVKSVTVNTISECTFIDLVTDNGTYSVCYEDGKLVFPEDMYSEEQVKDLTDGLTEWVKASVKRLSCE